ncbi:hypothetical protein D3C87_2082900 [compost metagenome]
MTREILRRTHDDHAQVGAYPYCDHISVYVLAETYACIKTISDYVGQCRIGRNLHLDFGVFG